jgi:rRNA maturation endonuclease Nob1
MIQFEKRSTKEPMRPKLDESSKTERVQIVAPRSWLDRVEEWRAQQRPVPNLSAAIRRLAGMALDAEERRQK